MKSSADMWNYQDTVSYLRAVSFISPDSGPWDLPCTAQWRKADERSCKNNLWYNLLDHVQKQTYFYLQGRLLWIKAFSSIFGTSETARLCTVSSIGWYNFVSQQEFKIKASHESKTDAFFCSDIFQCKQFIEGLTRLVLAKYICLFTAD